MRPQVCGFCCEVVEHADSLSHRMSNFMVELLRVPSVKVPAKMCSDCHRKATSARKFAEKCHRAFQKLERTGVKGGTELGTPHLPLGTGGVEYSLKVHGPLKFPKISLKKEDRSRAEAHMERSRSMSKAREKEREARREMEAVKDKKAWKERKARKEMEAKKKKKETRISAQHQSESEEEVFPAVGPFLCEICQQVSNTKQDFVSHIKVNHRDSIDPAVLQSLESDLEKRKKKLLEKSVAVEAIKRPKRQHKQIKRRIDSDSDDDFIPEKKKLIPEVEYRDEKGNVLPKNAGKCPAVCEVCGKNISRASDMLKHRQTLTCRANLQAASRDSSTLVVTVYNYQGDGDQLGHSNPIVKSQIVTQSTPVTKSQFVTQSTPVTKSQFVTQSTPVTKSQFVTQSTPVTKSQIVTQSNPVTKSQFVTQSTPVTESQMVPKSESGNPSKPVTKPECTTSGTPGAADTDPVEQKNDHGKQREEHVDERTRAVERALKEVVEAWQQEEDDVNSNTVISRKVMGDQEDEGEGNLVIDEEITYPKEDEKRIYAENLLQSLMSNM